MAPIEIVVAHRWFRVGEAYACVPHKNGTTSFRTAVTMPDPSADNYIMYDWARRHGLGPYEPDQLPDDGLPRYLAVREPVDRFQSLWRYVSRPGHSKNGFVMANRINGLSPFELMDVIEARPDENPHWLRQSFFECPNVIPVRYDRMLSVLGLPNVHKNHTARSISSGLEWPIERIHRHYARDVELWRQADANDL